MLNEWRTIALHFSSADDETPEKKKRKAKGDFIIETGWLSMWFAVCQFVSEKTPKTSN